MAVYKVIQDVEAEDKILGPLSRKQLIYAGIAVAIIFMAFKLVTATGNIFFAVPFLPFVVAFGALAAPISKDQTTEIWLAAQIRFFTKPRKRLWDQGGLKQLVNITVPKIEEKHYTDGLNQDQVHSRLNALANTLDSRGWAVKHANVNLASSPGYEPTQSDRLINASSLPQAVIDNPTSAADDILDVNNNQTAQNFDKMMKQSEANHKQAIIERIQASASQATTAQSTAEPAAPDAQPNNSQSNPPDDYSFIQQQSTDNQPDDNSVMFNTNVVQPGATPTTTAISTDDDLSEEEKAALKLAKEKQNNDKKQNNSHHKMVLTPTQLDKQAKENAKKAQAQAKADALKKEQDAKKANQHKTHLKKADTIELAKANNLKVSTIAGLAKHKAHSEPEEVVINLH